MRLNMLAPSLRERLVKLKLPVKFNNIKLQENWKIKNKKSNVMQGIKEAF